MEHINDVLSKLILPPRNPDADEYVGEDGLIYCKHCKTRGNSFMRTLRAASRQSSPNYASAERRRTRNGRKRRRNESAGSE